MKAVLKICNGNDKTLLDESLSGHKFHCPNCDMHLTSLGLCSHCGTRWELPDGPTLVSQPTDLAANHVDLVHEPVVESGS